MRGAYDRAELMYKKVVPVVISGVGSYRVWEEEVRVGALHRM